MKIQHKIYLNLIGLVVISLILVFVGVRPLIAKVKQLSQDYQQKNKTLISYQKKVGNYLQELEEKYSQLQTEVNQINQAFIDSEQAINLILKVEQLAKTTNNYQEIKEISLAEGEDQSLTFRVSLWGSYPNLIKFLAQVENMGYFVSSSYLHLTGIKESELRGLEKEGMIVSPGDVKSVLEINVYEQKN